MTFGTVSNLGQDPLQMLNFSEEIACSIEKLGIGVSISGATSENATGIYQRFVFHMTKLQRRQDA